MSILESIFGGEKDNKDVEKQYTGSAQVDPKTLEVKTPDQLAKEAEEKEKMGTDPWREQP